MKGKWKQHGGVLVIRDEASGEIHKVGKVLVGRNRILSSGKSSDGQKRVLRDN